MTAVLVTGGTGFIGAALIARLRADGVEVRAPGREAWGDWSMALAGADAVVHLAGPAHGRFGEDVLRAAIEQSTARLARQAEEAGVARFIFVSSIKASAARSYERAVSERDPPAPQDAYGRAKWRAEQAVLEHGRLNPVVLRPPLVHAPDARANFGMLLALAASGAPLPFAGLANRRSLISRAALIEAIKAALAEGPAGVFHLADRPSLSTPEIITALRRGLGLPARLFRAPPLASLAPAALTESLESDDSAFREAYGYGPHTGIDAAQALEATARAYRAART